MTREQAINYLICRGLTQEQVGDVVRALTYEPARLSVEEVTALAEWTEKLTKASEDAYNKGYEAGRKELEPITSKDKFIYALTACGCLLKDGKTWYEHNELIKCFEDLGLFEQEPISDILEDIYTEIEDEYEDCVIGRLDDDDDIMYPCFRKITDIYGVLQTLDKYIDKYKAETEE